MAETQQNLNAKLRLDASGWGAGIKSAEKKMERFGTNMFFIGSRISAAVTVPLGLLTRAVVKVGAGFDQAMTESLAIINDVSPKMRNQMEDTAKRIALTTKFSATEAAEAYFFLASSGMNAAETMQALPIVAKFAQAGVINLARATELLSDAYITLGLRTGDPLEQMQNMQRVADVLTEANNLAQGSIVEFSEALTNKAAVAMRVFGIGVEEGVAALAAFAERGVKGKLAGQQLFIVIRDLQRAVLKNNDAWTQLVGPGAVFDEATGELNNLADIIGTLENKLEGMSDRQKKATLDMLGFQERSLQATLTLVGASERMRELEIAFHNAGGVVDRVAKKQMTSFTNQMHLVTERISQIGIQIFDTFRPAFEQVILPLVREAITKLEGLVDWFGQLSIKTRATILSVLGLVAALGPAIAAFGGLILFITPALGVIKSMILPLVSLKAGFLNLHKPLMFFVHSGPLQVMGLARFIPQVGLAVTALALLKTGLDKIFPASKTFKEELHETVAVLDITSVELEEQIGIYTRLSGQQKISQTEAIHLRNAEMVLAEASGLTEEAFRREFQATDDLKTLFEEEIETLRRLEAAEIQAAATAVQSATMRLSENSRQLQAIREGNLVLDEQKSKAAAWIESWGAGGEFIVALGRLVLSTFHLIGAGAQWLLEKVTDAFSGEGILSSLSTFLSHIYTIHGSMEALAGVMNLAAGAMDKITGRDAGGGEDPDQRLADIKRSEEEREQLLKDQEEAIAALDAITAKYNETLEETNEGLERSTKTGAKDAIDSITDGFVGGEEASKAFLRKVDEMSNKIVGLGTNKLPVLLAAFAGLTDEQKKNEGILQRLWVAYKPIRKFMAPNAMPKEIENLTTKYREQEEHLKFLTTDAGKFVAAMGNVDLKLFDILTQQDAVLEQWDAMGGAMPDSFFENHGDTIEDLAAQYGSLAEEGLRDVIDAYFEWRIESHRTSSQAKGDVADAKRFIEEKSEDLNATLMSKASAFSLFTLNTQDAELIGLTRGMEERRLAQERMYVDMTAKAVEAGEENLLIELEKVNHARAVGQLILDQEERHGLMRILKARGFNQRQLEEAASLTAEELRILVDAQAEALAETRAFKDRMLVAGSLAGLFEQMGGGFAAIGQAIRDLSTDIDAFGESSQVWKNSQSAVEDWTSAIGMATAAYSAFNKISEMGGRGSRTVAGAATGAQMGSAFGPWGTVIGAGIGAIAGFFMDDPGWAKIQDAIATRFQTSVSDELAKQIEETAEEIGSDWGAMLLHLNDIIAESGGITAANVDHWTAQVRDAFSLTEFGALDLAGATEVLDENFSDLVEAGTLSSGVLKANVRELIELDAQFGTASEAIREFKEAMVDLAVEGLAAFAEGSKSVIDTLLEQYDLDVESAKEAHDRKVESQIAALDSMELSEEEYAERVRIIRENGAARWQTLSTEMALNFKNNFADKTRNEWEQLGAFTEMTFLAMMAGGASFLDALDAIDPSLEQLQRMTEVTGIKGSEMIDQLLRIRAFKEENEGLILQIQGMNQLMLGLGNSANLSQGDFNIFGEAAVTQFDRLIAGGLSSNDALLIMAPSLQTLKDLQEQYGFEVDENTQRLIDQGVEAGILGERARTTDEIMSEGLLAVAEGLGELIRLFGGDVPASIQHLSDVAREESGEINSDMDGVRENSATNFELMKNEAANEMQEMGINVDSETSGMEGEFTDLSTHATQAFRDIVVPDFDTDFVFTATWDVDEIPGVDRTGGNGGGPGPGPEGFQHGGIISRPTLMIGGEGGKPEMIGPVSFMSEALRGALGSGQGSNEVVSELQALREEIELLPIHIRDAIITSQ